MIRQSDALHARVRAFIAASIRGEGEGVRGARGGGGGEGRAGEHAERDDGASRGGEGAGRLDEEWEAIALEIARFQIANVGPVGRLARARGVDGARLTGVAEMPAVPTEVFRFARVAAHSPEEDVAVFRTSGTTSGARGQHAFRTLATYDAGALAWGGRFLFEGRTDFAVVSLTPPPEEAPDSSLVHMIELFARAQVGPVSFHLRGGALDVEGVERAVRSTWSPGSHRAGEAARSPVSRAAEAQATSSTTRSPDHPATGEGDGGRAVLLFGTSFAFVHAIDAAEGRELRLPAGSRAMLTGGFKGRSREVAADELRAGIARVFGISEAAVVGEYGMTELSSQLYEGTLVCTHGRHDVYTPPPWVRVVAVDPETLAPVPPGEVGIARIVDLANVDSAIAIQTADRVRVTEEGVELLGRLPGATPRGCSLAVEEVLG